MDRSIHHRWARRLRLAVAWAVAFHGSLSPWALGNLYAQTVDNFVVGVTPNSSAPPASITDLLASPNPSVQGVIGLTWTAPQGNVGGTPIANWPVAAYMIHYATFSVVSLGGSTSAWWSSTSANQIFLQAPAYIPQTPGQLEAYAISNLTPGTRYYFGVESISQGGITSPIDSLSATPAQQANAVATQIATGGAPKRPNGFSLSSFGGQLTIKWHPVTLDVNDQPVSIDHYNVYRYDDIGSTPTIYAVVSPSSLSYTDTVGGLTYFYRVFAVSAGGVTSTASDYFDSSPDMNRYVLASDDPSTRVVIPNVLSQELNSPANGYGEDLEIILTRRQQDEVDVTLRSYHVGVYKVISGEEIPFFAFSQAGMQVQLGLGAVLGSGQLNSNQVRALQGSSAATAGSIAQIVSVYWFNGGSYIRISDPVLTSSQALSVSVKNVGTYQIRATELTTQFKLTQNSPYPRVITPNDPSQNNRVFWFFDNPSGDPVTGTIYDIRGAEVKDLVMDGMSPTANSIVWNGRDANGSVVPSGVYLYRITTGTEKVTGTVVVAR